MGGFHAHSDVLLQQGWQNDTGTLGQDRDAVVNEMDLKSQQQCFRLVSSKYFVLSCDTDIHFRLL